MRDAFREFVDHLELDKGRAENTVDVRERHLREFSEWMDDSGRDDVEDVTRRDIAQYVDMLVDEGYASKTIMSRYSSVSVAYNFLHAEGRIDENPINRIKRQSIKDKARQGMTEREKKAENGPMDHLTKAEVYELAEHAPEPQDRNELFIKLLFWTGLRVSEAVRINIGEDGTLEGEGSDVHPDVPKITAYVPKTDSVQVVSYPPTEINPLLRDWVRNGRLRYKCATDTDRLFVGRKGGLTESGAGRVVDLAAQNMGIQEVKRVSRDGRNYKRVTPHLLRHSHAMHQHNEEGVPLDTLKDHLGHSSVNITEDFYAETTEERIIETFGR